MSRPRLALALLPALLAGPAWAGQNPGQNPAEVTKAVRQAALALAPAGATLTLGPVTGANYMQPCTVPLSVAMSGNAPYEQAAVHCTAPSWVLYVTVTVAQSENVVVAARPLTPGQPLTADDLKLASLPVQQFAGRQVYFDPAQLIGAVPDMALQTGMPITAPSVQAPIMVKPGQTVSVSVVSGGVELSLDAVALQTGRIGDTILLTNPSSGRRFTAQVTANGVQLVLQ